MTELDKARPERGWRRHLFYRKESIRTTWKLRISILLLGGLLIWASRPVWTAHIAESLVCTEDIAPSDALVLENFDPAYLVFERAAALHRAGVASRLLVPVRASRDPERPNTVSLGIAEVMARVARLPDIEAIPVQEIEPIRLNAAKQILTFLTQEHLDSVVVVTSGFESRRSSLVFDAVLTPAGIASGCAPVFGTKTPANWTDTLHGIQEVGLEFLKLQYYRFFVL